jgi:hypothetical protein
VTKLYWHRGDQKVEVRECLFKVSWSQVEESPGDGGLPRYRRVVAGTTLAIEWSEKPIVRAVLSTDRRPADRADTDELILRLAAADVLRFDAAAIGPTGAMLRGAVAAEVQGGVLRVRNAGRTLHVTREH